MFSPNHNTEVLFNNQNRETALRPIVERSLLTIHQQTENEQSATIQKNPAGVVRGGDDAGGDFVREWTHL